ncbi:MAG: Dna2/Cas4 domain-containing protein [Bdellovibrionales bacterium]|nr:Dna2/Cas4 domain-containing protein [Bdellovibrionales bacterium]
MLHQLVQLDSDLILYTVLIVSALIVVDDVLRAIKSKSKKSGLSASTALAINVDGSKRHKGKTYISEIQGISGRPDAVLLESGYFIPVERKAHGNKVRDRHIAQLLVYMRLVEEFEGKRPPYGYLIIGKNSRKVKIYNTSERQDWLSEQLHQMRLIAEDGQKASLKPHPRKCQRCIVQDHCEGSFGIPISDRTDAHLGHHQFRRQIDTL